jgi:molybdopterin-containing oxidoreductase family iron-sulfur binding subunit
MNTPVHQPRFDLARIREVTGGGSKRFWSSLEELIDEEGFRALLEAEFPAAASMFDVPGRRQFLKLMGASLLLGGLTACGETRSDQALPYVNQPEATIPGVPRTYATAVLFEGYAQPVIATTYDGRPTKLDGNPDHPATRGKSDPFMQSAIFGLYDPDRSKIPTHRGVASTWTAFEAELAQLRTGWRERQGDGLRVLTGAATSPTFVRQMGDLAKQWPKMRWHRFDPIGPARQSEAMTLAFGRPVTPHYRLDRCDVIVTLGHDLLGPGPHQVSHAMAWSGKRGEHAPGQGRSRLHVAESTPSLTGTVASTRLPCDASRLATLAQAIAAKFSLAGWTPPELHPPEQRWIERAVQDLRANRGRALLTIGPYLDPQWQAIAPLINEQLGNASNTVWYSEPIAHPGDEASSLAALATGIASGAVDTLVIFDSNPAYTASGALDFTHLLPRVPHRIHVGFRADETARLCAWHLPLSHPLESWSDARAVDGSATILQPVIAPLYDSRSAHQFIDMMLAAPGPADAAVRSTWQAVFGENFAEHWTRALHDGFVSGTQAPALTIAARTPASPPLAATTASGAIDVVFQPDPAIWDGRFANIAWLQELPKPLTKITWDNVVAISPSLASSQKLSNGDMVKVTVGKKIIRGPVWILPGQAPRTIVLTFGYGQRAGGDIATEGGFDAYAAQPAPHTFVARGSISRIDSQYPIATTQAHHRMDGFDFVREVTAKNPRTPPPKENHTFYPDWNEPQGPYNKPEHAWGMVIDLDLCIGCNACVSACNVENNVLVVGKDQVSRGREMAWLRVDRYYTGDVDNPKSFFQPVPCMHCEKAPCEMGCPVHATAHSPDGINQMAYNRCIGTRTCSSYCPYKVRRFNWYDYRSFADAEQAVKNPDVTVRSRGVMEKCSYCTQRIQAAQIAADKDSRPLRRDEITTACQQACPTTAIVFGDLKDNESAVAKRRVSGRHYALLEELGTRPRTTYLARWDDSGDEGGGV